MAGEGTKQLWELEDVYCEDVYCIAMLQAWEAMTQMGPDQERKHLAQADRHIIEVKKHILRQRVLVQKAIKTGRPSAEAQSMLEALQASLHAFEKHRQLILASLASAEKRPLSPIQPPRPYDHSLAQAASTVRDRSDR
jgi:hypothetical protein